VTVVATARRASSQLPGGWLLSAVEAAAGTVEVTTAAAGEPLVVVCDTGEGGSPAACTSVVLHPDGRAVLSCRLSPPALWLSRDGVRLAPQVPTDTEQLRLEPGDLLVLCTAEVLEHLHHGLPHLVEPAAALPDAVARVQSVAADLRAATPAGAAVVLGWSPDRAAE
jgi:hypothetical protein